MTDREQLRNLAVNLDMGHYIIMAEDTGVSKAAYRMLRSWMKLQPDHNTAHRNLFQAMKYADMLATIHLILPPKPEIPRLRRMAGTIDHFKAYINSASQQIVGT